MSAPPYRLLLRLAPLLAALGVASAAERALQPKGVGTEPPLAHHSASLAGSPAVERVYSISDLLQGGNTLQQVKSGRPPSAGPLPVNLTLVVSNILDIDQLKGRMVVQGTLILQWRDSRLLMPAGENRVQLRPEDVWMPEHDYYNMFGSVVLPATKLALTGATGSAVLTMTQRVRSAPARRADGPRLRPPPHPPPPLPPPSSSPASGRSA